MKTLDILPCAATPIILFLLLFFTHVKLEQGFEVNILNKKKGTHQQRVQ